LSYVMVGKKTKGESHPAGRRRVVQEDAIKESEREKT